LPGDGKAGSGYRPWLLQGVDPCSSSPSMRADNFFAGSDTLGPEEEGTDEVSGYMLRKQHGVAPGRASASGLLPPTMLHLLGLVSCLVAQ
jgi:hypothetical protein